MGLLTLAASYVWDLKTALAQAPLSVEKKVRLDGVGIRDDNPVALLEFLDTATNIVDDANGFVAHLEGYIGPPKEAVVVVEVAAADCSRCDAYYYVRGGFDYRPRNFLDDHFIRFSFPNDGFHGERLGCFLGVSRQ